MRLKLKIYEVAFLAILLIWSVSDFYFSNDSELGKFLRSKSSINFSGVFVYLMVDLVNQPEDLISTVDIKLLFLTMLSLINFLLFTTGFYLLQISDRTSIKDTFDYVAMTVPLSVVLFLLTVGVGKNLVEEKREENN